MRTAHFAFLLVGLALMTAALSAAPLIVTNPIPIVGSAVEKVGACDGCRIDELDFQFTNVPGTTDTISANGFTFDFNVCTEVVVVDPQVCSLEGTFTIDGITVSNFPVFNGNVYMHFPNRSSSTGLGFLNLYDLNNNLLASAAFQGFWTNVSTFQTFPNCTGGIAVCGETTGFNISPTPAVPEPPTVLSLFFVGAALMIPIRKALSAIVSSR